MPKAAETTLEINLAALAHNYRYLTSRIDAGIKLMAVVKAFAYGSDSVGVARKLSELGADYFAVAYTSEGISLRRGGISAPVLVLHPQTVNFRNLTDACLEPSLYSLLMLERFIAFAEGQSMKEYPVHIKINTGMNRIGFAADDLPLAVKMLEKTTSVKVKSVFSHLAASDDLSNKEFTQGQLKKFKEASEFILEKLDYTPLRHTLNTSGILNFPEGQYDMVRTGIGLYGFGNSEEENRNLIPVATLKTIISQIHRVKAEESVGYNFGFVAKKDTMIATLPLGHADGISRAYGNRKGYVNIHGKRADIIGNVCMDMLMVDITGIECEEGDEVIVFGENPTAEEFAATIGSIPYEIITAVSQRVKRIELHEL